MATISQLIRLKIVLRSQLADLCKTQIPTIEALATAREIIDNLEQYIELPTIRLETWEDGAIRISMEVEKSAYSVVVQKNGLVHLLTQHNGE